MRGWVSAYAQWKLNLVAEKRTSRVAQQQRRREGLLKRETAGECGLCVINYVEHRLRMFAVSVNATFQIDCIRIFNSSQGLGPDHHSRTTVAVLRSKTGMVRSTGS